MATRWSRPSGFIDHPPFNFNYSIDKPVYTVITVVKTVTFLGATALAATASIAAFLLVTGRSVSLLGILAEVLASRAFLALFCLGCLNAIRRIMFRLNDRDV